MATSNTLIGKSDDRLTALIRILYLLLFALLPFSIIMPFGSMTVEVPSEILMGLLAILLLVWFAQNGAWPRSFYYAPVTLTSLVFLIWMAIGILFSSDPIVSLKYWLVSITHWWLFYHGLGIIVKRLPQDLYRYWGLYALSFALIILYAWTVHAQYDFSVDSSVLVARPFYFDHALYSCVMLFLLGVFFVGFLLKNRDIQLGKYSQVLCFLIILVYLVGVYLSYSRAAWLSMLGALGFIGLVAGLRLRFRGLMGMLGSLLLILMLGWPFLFQQISQNQTESKKGGWWDQIVSVANVQTDVSNLERLNRYSCAWRMFKDRPVVGFGAGTYQEAYLPFQRKEEMTRISVTSTGPHPPGRGGGAHSEYLQALSEMGLPGALAWIALVFISIWTGLKIFHSNDTMFNRYLALAILFGLVTFFIHGLFNNFIHHGKVAGLVWSGLAVLVSYNINRAQSTPG